MRGVGRRGLTLGDKRWLRRLVGMAAPPVLVAPDDCELYRGDLAEAGPIILNRVWRDMPVAFGVVDAVPPPIDVTVRPPSPSASIEVPAEPPSPAGGAPASVTDGGFRRCGDQLSLPAMPAERQRPAVALTAFDRDVLALFDKGLRHARLIANRLKCGAGEVRVSLIKQGLK